MAIERSYTDARANLAKLMDRVVDDAETVVIRRKNGKDVAIVAADELERLATTTYLLASPRNRQRLTAALKQSRRGQGRRMTNAELREAAGL